MSNRLISIIKLKDLLVGAEQNERIVWFSSAGFEVSFLIEVYDKKVRIECNILRSYHPNYDRYKFFFLCNIRDITLKMDEEGNLRRLKTIINNFIKITD